MIRFNVEPFQDGDRVTKGEEHGVVVMLTNRETGDMFPMVWISNGPRKNQREYPRKGWHVQLDLPDGDQEIRCAECEREFKRKTFSGDVFCFQCQRRFNQAEKRRSQDATPSHQFGTKVRK